MQSFSKKKKSSFGPVGCKSPQLTRRFLFSSFSFFLLDWFSSMASPDGKPGRKKWQGNPADTAFEAAKIAHIGNPGEVSRGAGSRVLKSPLSSCIYAEFPQGGPAAEAQFSKGQAILEKSPSTEELEGENADSRVRKSRSPRFSSALVGFFSGQAVHFAAFLPYSGLLFHHGKRNALHARDAGFGLGHGFSAGQSCG